MVEGAFMRYLGVVPSSVSPGGEYEMESNASATSL